MRIAAAQGYPLLRMPVGLPPHALLEVANWRGDERAIAKGVGTYLGERNIVIRRNGGQEAV